MGFLECTSCQGQGMFEEEGKRNAIGTKVNIATGRVLRMIEIAMLITLWKQGNRVCRTYYLAPCAFIPWLRMRQDNIVAYFQDLVDASPILLILYNFPALVKEFAKGEINGTESVVANKRVYSQSSVDCRNLCPSYTNTGKKKKKKKKEEEEE
ncbi:hypothetical protein COCMIDRAFT_37638 [Bipolaris oryzae ATCC 44560]|uniref:Uncharacterized protein n=1 Tax=Bipolaris oryzae ATCC 44560 TaxID=930090 RepID=W6Z479_COCMI|nr:uncharacterized protein COCMIDRAFT_37638 [Bipolaris oryzae ATCC 44560]EUC44548.1 hypothetical protein COCMIDRAFT_37638 [Bipolaris oryzae ATCC 44560]